MFSDTIREMMLMDDDEILERMSRDDEFGDQNNDNEGRVNAIDNVTDANGSVQNRMESPDVNVDSDGDIDEEVNNAFN